MKKILIKIFQFQVLFRTQILPKIFVFSPFFSSLYYLLFSSQFKREQHAVLKGKMKHLKDLKFHKNNIYTLIRNVHRVEKGLIMKERRLIFAVDFITETMDAFVALWSVEKMEGNLQYRWFYDVLNEYFSVTGSHAVIDVEKARFQDHTKRYITKERNIDSIKNAPYKRELKLESKISYDQFYDLTVYRRSVRWFLDKKVSHDLVDKAILAAKQSPSACNRQPFKFKIFDDPILLKQVANLPMGVKGYVEGIPMMIAVVGSLDAYFDERDRHIIYIDGSLASMTFMYALETLGLSSCAINWPDIEVLEKKMESTLKLEKHERVIMCIAVGHPDLDLKVAYSGKRDISDIRTYNK
ncbi:nitroreductase family protein [Polaribacter sp. 20A6]|uniref:nitroreductase family protein n=1 Tax=Polaribacter sp. 20A6 TaxID=2687289 RepID=UPI0013FDAF0C|nr:nitroreductase family protein [Polaribacter sp. 20A6]